MKGMIPANWLDHFPKNVRLMITVCNQEEADRDIPKLLSLPCRNGISYEPALGPVDWSPFLMPRVWSADGSCRRGDIYGGKILEWVIVGGESAQGGHPARPLKVEWARFAVQQCKAAGVPVFVKQLGSNTLGWCYGNRPGDGDPDCNDVDCQVWEASEGGQCPEGSCCMRQDRAGADPDEWPLDLRVREFPV